MTRNLLGFAAGAMGCHGVIAGAFGSHYLRNRLDEDQMRRWNLAVTWQMWHASALVGVSAAIAANPAMAAAARLRWAGRLWTAGTGLFSGSLYGLALGGSGMVFGPLMPVGGTAMLLGWACAASAFL